MKVVDLFAGCGGLSLGFQNAGFDIVAAFDKWPIAVDIYCQNFEHPSHQKDLSKKDSTSLIIDYHPDMIIGGPPCQDFSSAGKRDETLGRADLTTQFAELVTSIQPNWFVMENVERIKNTQTLKETIKIFKQYKYGLTSRVLDASYCGVPQKRKRFFLIGRHHGKDDELQHYLSKNLARKPMTLFDYFGDSLGIEAYYRHPRSYKRRGIFSIYEPSPTVRGVNRPIPKTYQMHKGDRCDTLDDVRPLTTTERSYVQTFPKNFKFVGTKSNLEQMIGNAVPVKLAEYVANAIKEFEEDRLKNAIVHVKQFKQLKLELF